MASCEGGGAFEEVKVECCREKVEEGECMAINREQGGEEEWFGLTVCLTWRYVLLMKRVMGLGDMGLGGEPG